MIIFIIFSKKESFLSRFKIFKSLTDKIEHKRRNAIDI